MVFARGNRLLVALDKVVDGKGECWRRALPSGERI
jgi:hypothetical protein